MFQRPVCSASSQSNKNRRKVTKMIISVTVMFAVSWLPIQVRHATDAFFYYCTTLPTIVYMFTCLCR